MDKENVHFRPIQEDLEEEAASSNCDFGPGQCKNAGKYATDKHPIGHKSPRIHTSGIYRVSSPSNQQPEHRIRESPRNHTSDIYRVSSPSNQQPEHRIREFPRNHTSDIYRVSSPSNQQPDHRIRESPRIHTSDIYRVSSPSNQQPEHRIRHDTMRDQATYHDEYTNPVLDRYARKPTSSVSSGGSIKSLPVISPTVSRITNSSNKISSPRRSPQRCVSASRSKETRRSLSSSTSEAVCRICHGSASGEQLFSPCYCSGSIGLLHVSCLQRWLGSSNKTCCELCNFQFKLERSPKPFRMFLKNPGRRRDKRHLICDIICFALLTPVTIATAYMCVVGSRMYDSNRIEAILLYCLALSLIFLFSAWMMMCVRHNYGLWKEWKQFNQNVRIICEPSTNVQIQDMNSRSKAKLQRVKICSIKIKVSTNMSSGSKSSNPSFQPTGRGIRQQSGLTQSNVACSIEDSGVDSETFTRVNPDNLSRSQSYPSTSSDSRSDMHSKYRRENSPEQVQCQRDELYSTQSNFAGRQRSTFPSNPRCEEFLSGCSKDTYI